MMSARLPEADNNVWKHLHQVTIADLIKEKEGAPASVITVKEDATVEEAVKLMGEHKIVSLPVVAAGHKTEVIGIVDMLDIVAVMNRLAPRKKHLDETHLGTFGRAIAYAKVGKILNLSGRSAYIPCYTNSPVTMAVQFFAGGVHHMPVLDKDEKLVGVISQSDVIRHIHSCVNEAGIKTFGALPIDKLWLGCQGSVASVEANASVFEALRIMRINVVSALAVVKDGKLLGNLSARDFRGMFIESLPSLSKEVQDFAVSATSGVVCVQSDASVREVMATLVDNKVHRVWVIDDDYKPIGVVSMTDLMLSFVRHDSWLESNWI